MGRGGGGDSRLWVMSRGGAAALAFIAQRRSRLGPCDGRNSVPINRVKKLPCWRVHMSMGLILQAREVRGGGRKNSASRTPRQSRRARGSLRGVLLRKKLTIRPHAAAAEVANARGSRHWGPPARGCVLPEIMGRADLAHPAKGSIPFFYFNFYVVL
jgi:hypothetical protein